MGRGCDDENYSANLLLLLNNAVHTNVITGIALFFSSLTAITPPPPPHTHTRQPRRIPQLALAPLLRFHSRHLPAGTFFCRSFRSYLAGRKKAGVVKLPGGGRLFLLPTTADRRLVPGESIVGLIQGGGSGGGGIAQVGCVFLEGGLAR